MVHRFEKSENHNASERFHAGSDASAGARAHLHAEAHELLRSQSSEAPNHRTSGSKGEVTAKGFPELTIGSAGHESTGEHKSPARHETHDGAKPHAPHHEAHHGAHHPETHHGAHHPETHHGAHHPETHHGAHHPETHHGAHHPETHHGSHHPETHQGAHHSETHHGSHHMTPSEHKGSPQSKHDPADGGTHNKGKNHHSANEIKKDLNHMVGQQFWKGDAGATNHGRLGCAVAVTSALKHLGVPIGKHLDVNSTEKEMKAKGWKEVSLKEAMKSGKAFVAVKEGAAGHHGHVGIGVGNQIWENSSAKGRFVTRDIHNSSLIHSQHAYIVPS